MGHLSRGKERIYLTEREAFQLSQLRVGEGFLALEAQVAQGGDAECAEPSSDLAM